MLNYHSDEKNRLKTKHCLINFFLYVYQSTKVTILLDAKLEQNPRVVVTTLIANTNNAAWVPTL